MDPTSIESINSAFAPKNDLFSSKAINSQIQLLRQTIARIEKSSVENDAKNKQISVLEMQLENLEKRLEILHYRKGPHSDNNAQKASGLQREREKTSVVPTNELNKADSTV